MPLRRRLARWLDSPSMADQELVPLMWAGIRGYHAVFNVPGDDVTAIVRGYRAALDALVAGETPSADGVRHVVGTEFTRGHFARAV